MTIWRTPRTAGCWAATEPTRTRTFRQKLIRSSRDFWSVSRSQAPRPIPSKWNTGQLNSSLNWIPFNASRSTSRSARVSGCFSSHPSLIRLAPRKKDQALADNMNRSLANISDLLSNAGINFNYLGVDEPLTMPLENLPRCNRTRMARRCWSVCENPIKSP